VAHLLPELVVPGAREAVALALVLLGAVVAVSGYRRWQIYQRALRRADPLPPTRLPGILMAALTGLAVLTLALLLAGQGLRP
jgi:putative membrane protein